MKKEELKEIIRQEVRTIVTEGKQEADSFTLRHIEIASDKNFYGESRQNASMLMNDHRLTKSYTALGYLEDLVGMSPELPKIRNKLDKILKKELQKKYENWEEIWKRL